MRESLGYDTDSGCLGPYSIVCYLTILNTNRKTNKVVLTGIMWYFCLCLISAILETSCFQEQMQLDVAPKRSYQLHPRSNIFVGVMNKSLVVPGTQRHLFPYNAVMWNVVQIAIHDFSWCCVLFAIIRLIGCERELISDVYLLVTSKM